MRALLVAFGLLLVSGCADQPPRTAEHFHPAPAAPPGYATLYIYRGYMENGAWIWPIAYLNDVKVADVKTWSYTYVYIWPGKYHLRAEKSNFWVQFNDDQRVFDFVIPTVGNYYLQFGNGGSAFTMPAGHTFVSIDRGEYGWFLVPEAAAQPVISRTLFLSAYAQTVGHE